jgi:hypothetical protein
MTRNTNARVAGFMFLFYIANGVATMVVLGRGTSGDGIAAMLTTIAQHTTLVRWGIVLTMLMFVDALVLGVALYGLTRDEDHELALLALSCRILEGALGAFPVTTLGLLWLATGADGATAPDATVANTLGALLLKVGEWKTIAGATCFAVGSTIFSYLFLRARTIPVPLAWLGVMGSLLIVAALPLRLAGFISGPVTNYVWIPIALFEVVLGFLLLFKGIAAPTRVRAT